MSDVCEYAHVIPQDFDAVAEDEDIVICTLTNSVCIHDKPVKNCIMASEDETVTKVQKRKEKWR